MNTKEMKKSFKKKRINVPSSEEGAKDLVSSLLNRLKLAKEKQGEFDERLRTKDVNVYAHKKFESFGLTEEMLEKLEELEYAYPSPAQYNSIPYIKEGRSVVVRAKNGTGKTASYLIPIVDTVQAMLKKEFGEDAKKMKGVKPEGQKLVAIVLVPTRELALQVSKVARRLAGNTHVEVMPTYGGTNLHLDILRLKKGVSIMVGTPGRILDMVEREIVPLDLCATLVFDEADKLLSQEFSESITSMISALPGLKQTLLFSATYPENIQNFVRSHIKNPVQINLMKELSLVGVHQFYALVDPKDKLHCLQTLIKKIDFDKAIIFCNTIRCVELLAKKVASMGFSTYFIHSQMTQEERNKVFFNFTEGKCRVLISSDLVTRGIDVPKLNCVINFDFPNTTESYLHRIGRSGRFGTRAIAVSLMIDQDKEKMMEIEEVLGIDIKAISNEKFKEFQKQE